MPSAVTNFSGQPSDLISSSTDTPGVLFLTLNRPEKLNALSRQLLQSLGSLLTAAQQCSDVRCVVLTGSQRSFSVGADIQDFAQRGVLAYLDPERLGAWSVIEAAASSEKAREQSAPAGPRGGARITLLPPVSCAPMLAHISRRFRCVPRRRKTRTEVTVFTEG
jgi:hypothetical protein